MTDDERALTVLTLSRIVDARPGGRWRFRTIDLPDLGVLAVSGAFREVSPPARLAYTWRWEEADAAEMLVTVAFGERGDQTEVTVRHEGFTTERVRDEHVQGWSDCLDRLLRAASAGELGV